MIQFTNNNKLFASIKDIKNNKWELLNLKFEKIDRFNFKNVFENKFNKIEEVNNYYDEIFLYLPTSNKIDNTHIFERGGRSYTQSPFGRIKYKIYNMIKNLKE